MTSETTGVAIVGCGNIAQAYARQLAGFPEIDLLGVQDVDAGRARALAAAHGVRVYGSLAELLADPGVEIVVNLTVHRAHYEVIRRCLEAGKHVHSEKPLALTHEEAAELVELADKRGLRLGGAPATFLGEAQQTALKLLRENAVGQVRLVYGEVNWGRIEVWHPDPVGFYEVGPLFDVGVYPLTMTTAALGPARRVQAFASIVRPQRVRLDGTPFTLTTPDYVVADVEFDGGVRLRLTCDFYVDNHNTHQHGLEFHGDDGSLLLHSWQNFDSVLEMSAFREELRPVPPVREPYAGVEWGRPVRDLAAAIREERPHRATGAQAAHVVEILCAIRASYETGRPVDLVSSFVPAAPMEWAL
ncbi:Gfo/Idh/MocA family oxidoreductase [Nonomuraea glycinis]|uniref:Dehydrogenase n=1 Tax=Nonomuraea glycinis TaxID=2047744 RepID=A0A918E3G9_9ACTN|nr:Gfo/Idh/MocA family oxidoreductase [Nonomuraea glycinis]MCA2174883.1 Gfo/Idh/MocA family oxidoreductase [Nonomuraea glycinis]GGP01462.1 dehydrogenase [Nonomuraea glycinis]